MKNILILQKRPEIKDQQLIRRALRREGDCVKTKEQSTVGKVQEKGGGVKKVPGK